MNEMKFLNWFEGSNKTQAVIHRCQKIFNFLNGTTQFNHVKIPDLTLEEEMFLEYISKQYSKKHDGQEIDFSNYMDSSMIITFEDIVIKIIYVDDYEFNYIPYEYEYVDPYSNATVQQNKVFMYVISKEAIDGDNFIATMYDIIHRFFSEYIMNLLDKRFYGLLMPASSIKTYVDILIVEFRTLDSIFDLKFNDYKLIKQSNTSKEHDDTEEIIFDFAITQGTTVEDYENLLKKIFLRFRFDSKIRYNNHAYTAKFRKARNKEEE